MASREMTSKTVRGERSAELDTRNCNALSGSAGNVDSDHRRSISELAATVRPGDSSSSGQQTALGGTGKLTGASSMRSSMVAIRRNSVAATLHHLLPPAR